jgi:NAD(P)H-flavin reductase
MNEISGARIVENREVARGSRWLVLESEDIAPGWEPGHIAAIYVPDLGGGWVRHPYTISAVEPERLGILYRVIPGGRITPQLAELPVGATLRLGGRFGEPVRRLAPSGPVVGVSTGTGVGPLYGFARTQTGRSITLITGFREAVDIPFSSELTTMGVDWRPVLSRPHTGYAGRVGHVGEHLAEAPKDAHFHLVGNGVMVAEVRAALLEVGVPKERVTTETYFNKGAPPDPERVAAITMRLQERW